MGERLEARPGEDEALMRRALLLAELAAELGEVPVGAVVARDGEVIGQGLNLRELSGDPTAHAEVVAMRQAARHVGNWRLDECVLAVTLEPCPMCAGAMVNARLGRLVYGCRDPKMGCVASLYQLCEDGRFNHRVMVEGGVSAEACGAVLTRFFERRRSAERAAKPRLDASLDVMDWQRWVLARGLSVPG